jgi:hypothetical protein
MMAWLATKTKEMELPLCPAQELAAQYYLALSQETGLLVMDYPLPALVLGLLAMARPLPALVLGLLAMARPLPALVLGLLAMARPLPDFQTLLLKKAGLP